MFYGRKHSATTGQWNALKVFLVGLICHPFSDLIFSSQTAVEQPHIILYQKKTSLELQKTIYLGLCCSCVAP